MAINSSDCCCHTAWTQQTSEFISFCFDEWTTCAKAAASHSATTVSEHHLEILRQMFTPGSAMEGEIHGVNFKSHHMFTPRAHSHQACVYSVFIPTLQQLTFFVEVRTTFFKLGFEESNPRWGAWKIGKIFFQAKCNVVYLKPRTFLLQLQLLQRVAKLAGKA